MLLTRRRSLLWLLLLYFAKVRRQLYPLPPVRGAAAHEEAEAGAEWYRDVEEAVGQGPALRGEQVADDGGGDHREGRLSCDGCMGWYSLELQTNIRNRFHIQEYIKDTMVDIRVGLNRDLKVLVPYDNCVGDPIPRPFTNIV